MPTVEPDSPPRLPRLAVAVTLAALAASPARAFDANTGLVEADRLAAPGTPAAPAVPAAASVRPAPGVEIQYQSLATDAAKPGPARVEGVLDGGGARLRSSVRIDPAGERRIDRLDTSFEAQAPGPLQSVVVGDTWGSGGGWSQPVRLAGLRMGRSLALRAAPGVAAPAPVAGQPTFGGPAHLAAGATDHEVEIGRVRAGDTADAPLQAPYAAAAWRAGLGARLTAEARSEWTTSRLATGVELVRDGGGGNYAQASLAQSQSTTTPEAGLRWGMGWVRNSEGTTWSLAYEGAERGYTQVLGGTEPRAGVRAGARLALARGASADVRLSRTAAWDAAASGTEMALGAQLPLAHKARLSLDLAVRDGTQAGWRAGLAVQVPLDPRP